jgi:dynein heavy chain, axonemal
LTCTIKFEVDNNLFKGFLLAPHQVEETSKRRDKVAEVEKAFYHWMKQIKVCVSQGHQLVRDGPDAGPLKELEHWRNMLTKLNNVVEFTNSRPFRNYLRCLKLSRSKLIQHWKQTEDELIVLLNEARDNVRYMTSIEKYWEPLYRDEPKEIAESLSNLLQAIRTVYNTSRFYNTNLRITGFLSKVVNQLIIASQKFLTSNGTISIWSEEMKVLLKKIKECKKLKESFHYNYDKIINEMKYAGETLFECSEKFLFTRLESFETRLIKIREIMEVIMRYQVLDRVKIFGMESFAVRIKEAFKLISEKSYDPLAHRDQEFNDDFTTFQKQINVVELEMEVFVKRYLEDIDTVEMRLMTMKRFERLNLECLCLDRRFLDVAVMLEKEIEDLKDKYNEERANPPISRNVPPIIGRILWSRSLQKKMEQPLNVLKAHPCVIEHPKAQLCVKYYNYLTGILFHYEAMHHKAWFTYADQVRSKLEIPLIRKDPETNFYEVNLDKNVFQVIKETEGMWKLGLKVPETAEVLTYCQQRVIDAFNNIVELIKRNNNLRRSIYPIFTPLMRIHLIKLERVFAPALTTVTWLSLNHEEYFTQIVDVMKPIEDFVKEVSDINDAQIEVALNFINHSLLIYLPNKPVLPSELKELNVNYRKEMEQKIEQKSIAAEKSAIDLINKFVEKSGVPDYDESGKFQVPPDQITEENWRTEEFKPIDKYDWLSFGKLYKAVGYASQEENEKLCFGEYDGLRYDVTLLHIDCVELFAYYNHKIIAALAKATKRSMEIYKERSNIGGQILSLECGKQTEKSLFKASIELHIPNFKLVPSMQEIQQHYEEILQNIIETHYAIDTWGKQAKTEERMKRKPLIDEIRHEHNWFRMIFEHKDVKRYKMGFDNGVMQLENKINSIMIELKGKYEYLWDEEREMIIEEFVNGKPLTADIRDKFRYYDEITSKVLKLNKVLCVRTIEIDCEQMINALAEESKIWRNVLGEKLSAFYREILNEIVKFIQTYQKMLSRELKDLDDCRIAMNCLEVIRENFTRIDHKLGVLEETYAVFSAFHINIPAEDIEHVDGLRYMFNTLIKTADEVNLKVFKLQVPLQQELESGVIQLKKNLEEIDNDFIKRGPFIAGLSPKEASDRVMLFEIRFEELSRRYEVYSSGEKLFGLPVNEYPLLMQRKHEVDLLKQLYTLYLEVLKSFETYSEIVFKEADLEKMKEEVKSFVHR